MRHTLVKMAELVGQALSRATQALLEADLPIVEASRSAASFLELRDQVLGDTAALRDFVSLLLGPATNLRGVGAGGSCCRTPATSTGPADALGLASRLDVLREAGPQLLCVLAVQVDHILRTIQAKRDCLVSLAAIEIIDKLDFYLLGHDSLSFQWGRCGDHNAGDGKYTNPSATA